MCMRCEFYSPFILVSFHNRIQLYNPTTIPTSFPFSLLKSRAALFKPAPEMWQHALGLSGDAFHLKRCDVTILYHQISITITPTPPHLSQLNAPPFKRCAPGTEIPHSRTNFMIRKSQMLRYQTLIEKLPRKMILKALRTICFLSFFFILGAASDLSWCSLLMLADRR